MSSFATLSVEERRILINEVASRLNLAPIIVEKDFWVTWVLGRIFATPAVAPHVVFKGGTSLSKVFGVIDRFSEDVDLAVSPGVLGFKDADLDEAPSRSQRLKLMAKLAAASEVWVRDQAWPELEAVLTQALGGAATQDGWLSFEIDSIAATPNLWFAYPSVLPGAGGYIAQRVKLELGALTSQQPMGDHTIQPILAQEVGNAYDDLTSKVVVLDLARTFWEKATILHAEFHRPPEKAIQDRLARHYADFAALWRHESRRTCTARLDLLEDVVKHKGRFFASAWATYATARPGTFHLAPSVHRMSELAKDYDAMKPMFLHEPVPFAELMDQLQTAEDELNAL